MGGPYGGSSNNNDSNDDGSEYEDREVSDSSLSSFESENRVERIENDSQHLDGAPSDPDIDELAPGGFDHNPDPDPDEILDKEVIAVSSMGDVVRGKVTGLSGTSSVEIDDELFGDSFANQEDIKFISADGIDSENGGEYDSLEELLSNPTFAYSNGDLTVTRTQNRMFKEWLASQYGDDQVEHVMGRPSDDRELTWGDTMDGWNSRGYWNPNTKIVWDAAMERTDHEEGDYPPRMKKNLERGTDPTYNDEAMSAVQDTIDASQMYASKYLADENGNFTVYRGIRNTDHSSMADNAEAAKSNGESLEISPRALESWTVDRDMADSYGEVVLEREISVDDVGFWGPLAAARNKSHVEEVTVLGKDDYEISPDEIDVK